MIAVALLAVVALAAIGGLFLQAHMHSRIVANLCQRIQAPETAVAQHALGSMEFQPAHLPYEDDEAWQAHASGIGRDPLNG